jgi:hypothetical protein
VDNPERARETMRQWRRDNPGAVRAAWDRWAAEHPEERAASRKRWRDKNPGYHEDYQRDQGLEWRRRVYQRCVHGRDIDKWFAEAWDAQDGCCYLCGDPLNKMPQAPQQGPHIEHDHTCCPSGRSCTVCRRGLSCRRCNSVIAFVGDDLEGLDLLERIVANARPAFIAARERIARNSTEH